MSLSSIQRWPAWACRLVAALLVVLSAGLHFAYLYDCPLDLAPDEAHYWDWSRHLDWSYYSKGPLVAWLIRGSCALAGDWSVAHTGNLALAIRLPAVICGSLLLFSLYVLTVQIYRREALALAVVALSLTLPLIAVGSSLMTIDAPYTCLWGWALVLAHRAVFCGSRWAWSALGVVVGLGVLAKYTMAVFVPSLFLFLVTDRSLRPRLRQPGFWVMSATAALCCLPIVIWNAQHDWVTLRHLLGLSGISSKSNEPRFQWLGPAIYLGQQCGLFLVGWFVAWVGAMIVHRPWRETDQGLCYLWWLSAPMFVIFLVFSPRTGGGEANWPVTAYLSGLVLAASWIARQLHDPRAWYRRLAAAGLVTTCTLGLVGTGFMHFSDRLYPLLGSLVGPPRDEADFPLRRLDPTCRLRGWHRGLAREVDAIRAQLLRQEGAEPVLVALSWTMPGELGVYCQGHPQVYSIGPVTGDRHSQYDLWPGPLSDPEGFRGRTFLVIGGLTDAVKAGFDEVGQTRFVVYCERGQPVTGWWLTVCRGFRGRFPKSADGRHY